MSNSVLDASALLAVVNEEPGAALVLDALEEGALLSSVNLCEVVTKLVDSDFDEDAIRAIVAGTGVRVVELNESHAYAAGILRSMTRRQGLSLGDRACLALAVETGLPALTADRLWLGLDVGVELQLIR